MSSKFYTYTVANQMQMLWNIIVDKEIIAQVIATERNIKRIVELMNKGENT